VYYLLAIGVTLLCLSVSCAQTASILMGARSSGLSNASACLKDEWSLFNNVAGLADLKKTAASVTYDTQPGFAPFNKMASVFAMPIKPGVAGVGFFRFGDDLYNEQVFTIGFANTYGLASLGVKVNYIQYTASGFGSKGVFSVSFGGIAELAEKIFLGAHVININQPDISKNESEKLPTILVVGIGAQITTQTFFTTELEKDLDHPLKWKTGFEYKAFKKFTARTGFSINPGILYFGFGFQQTKFSLDYAYQHNFVIGSRHQATVGYFLGRRQ
jgi:hypothetical protein